MIADRQTRWQGEFIRGERWIFDPTDAATLERLLRKRTREREEALMVAILEDAIDCYQKYVFARAGKGKKLFEETERWIFERDVEWLFSFESICETLRLNPGYLRRGLLQWKQAAVDAEAVIEPQPRRSKRKKRAA